MAYGKGGFDSDPNVKKLNFNLKTKDLPAPVFEVTTKQDGATVTLDSASFVSGTLTGVRHKEGKYQNKTIESVTVTLREGAEIYYVSVPYSYLGRNLLNALLGLKTFSNVKISVYKGKPKGDKPAFDECAIRQNGELVYGKHRFADLPKINKVKVGGNEFGDPTEINRFFRAEIEALDKRVQEGRRPAAPVAAGATDTPAEEAGDDIPF